MERAFHLVICGRLDQDFNCYQRLSGQSQVSSPTSKVVEAELVKDPLVSTHTLVANHHTPLKNLEVIIDCKKFGTFQKLLQVTS